MKLPILMINFKTYAEARGEKGVGLAKSAEKIAKEYGINITVIPQLLDTITIAQQVEIPVFAQHIDPNDPGSATGHIDPFTLAEYGVQGTLLNHSERSLNINTIAESVQLASEANLLSVVCAGTIQLSHAVSVFEPWAVAMEPPELIGGDVSVTTRPNIVKNAVEAIKLGCSKTIPLTGAGVKSAEHIDTAVQLGSKGVLLASGVVKAKDPEFVMTEMAKIMKNL